MTRHPNLTADLWNQRWKARLRLISRADIMPLAWEHAKKYSRRRFRSIYIDHEDLIAYFKEYDGNCVDLENEVIADFEAMYIEIATRLDELYEALWELYCNKEVYGKGKMRPFDFGEPQLSPEGIQTCFEQFKAIFAKQVPMLEKKPINLNNVAVIQGRLRKGIEFVEEAITELIRTLTAYYNFQREMFDRRLKILNTFISALRLGATASGAG